MTSPLEECKPNKHHPYTEGSMVRTYQVPSCLLISGVAHVPASTSVGIPRPYFLAIGHQGEWWQEESAENVRVRVSVTRPASSK